LADRGTTAPPERGSLGRSRPSSSRQIEQPLSLGVRPVGVGIGIDEHVLVVEGGDEVDLDRARSMPLPNTSPDMSPMPTTVNGSRSTSTPSSAKCLRTETHAPRAVMPIALWS
jgi:hypothetical protein